MEFLATDWQHQALCRGLTGFEFIPDEDWQRTQPPAHVAVLCPQCSVRAQCEEYGRSTRSSGWWGGTFLQEEREERHALGGRNPNVKLTWDDVEKIRHRYAAGYDSLQKIASAFGISRQQVHDIVRLRKWKQPPVDVAPKTHCFHDHELTPENTYWYKGEPCCKECRRKAGREWYRRHSEFRQRLADIDSGHRWISVMCSA